MKSFVTTYRAMLGWKAVQMWWNTETEEYEPGSGFWEPYDVGYFQYPTREEAEIEARQWAESEELEFRP